MTTDDYKTVRNEAGKDAAKAMAFFFIGLPVLCFLSAWIIL